MKADHISREVQLHFQNNSLHFKVQKGTSRELAVPHAHDYLQIWYVLRGSFRHVVDNRDYIQAAGDLLIVPPYTSHQIDTSRSEDVEFIFCDMADNFLNLFPEGMEKNTLFNLTCLRPLMYNAASATPFLSFTGEAAQRIESLYLELLTEYKKACNLSPIYIRSDLVRLLALIAEEYDRAAPQKDGAVYARYRIALQDAMDYIELHYTEPISREEVCKIALMSVSSFSYVFKQITGQTFMEYLHLLRIRCAQKLLRETSLSVTEICLNCGFSDITHFGRIFKKNTGLSPNQYLKLHRER